MSNLAINTLVMSDGATVPWIAYGSGTAFYLKSASDAVALALRSGFNHIDTAQIYENEESVAEGIASSGVPRSAIFITTKLGPLNPKDPGGVEGALKESLRKLNVDYVDLYLVHAPLYHQQYPGRLEEVWKEMVAVKAKGLTKSIGVSNFQLRHLEKLKATGLELPVVNQIEYSPFVCTTPDIIELLAYHKAHQILTASYAGFTPLIPDRAKDPSLQPAIQALTTVLNKAVGKRGEGVTHTQILLKWLQQKGILVVTTSTKESRIKEYLTTSAVQDLNDEEIREIEASCDGVNFRAFAMGWPVED